jgi:CheY-like chemotaxis protein
VTGILIVDDERDIRDSLGEFFEDEGYLVTTAENGAVALTRLTHDHVPCVVILDLLMPVLDGNELYDRMQSDPRLKKIPVIVSTSDPTRAPSGVLTLKKPIDLGRLLDLVKKHCGQPA